jgi:hypothetical protein
MRSSLIYEKDKDIFEHFLRLKAYLLNSPFLSGRVTDTIPSPQAKAHGKAGDRPHLSQLHSLPSSRLYLCNSVKAL